MRRIEIEIMRSANGVNARVNTWRKAQAGKSVTRRISFGDISDLFSSITDKRFELLRHVTERQDRLTPRLLARCLGRDYGSVRDDVSALEALGLITKDEGGRLSVPYQDSVVPGGLTEAA